MTEIEKLKFDLEYRFQVRKYFANQINFPESAWPALLDRIHIYYHRLKKVDPALEPTFEYLSKSLSEEHGRDRMVITATESGWEISSHSPDSQVLVRNADRTFSMIFNYKGYPSTIAFFKSVPYTERVLDLPDDRDQLMALKWYICREQAQQDPDKNTLYEEARKKYKESKSEDAFTVVDQFLKSEMRWVGFPFKARIELKEMMDQGAPEDVAMNLLHLSYGVPN